MLVPAIAAACTCSKLPETCDLLAQREVAIAGTVLDESGLFRVEKAVRGLPADTRMIRIQTGASSSCGLAPRPGERWLIFGTRGGDGTVNTHACSGSRRIDRKMERVVDSFVSGPNLVMGTVRRFGSDDRRIAGAEVGLTGPETRTIRTSHDGSFEFAALMPGEYQLDVQSAGLAPTRSQGGFIEMELRPFRVEARGCIDVPVTMHASQSIRGTIRTPAGKPAADVLVHLVQPDEEGSPGDPVKSDWTSAEGTYEFRRVENGTYTVEAGGETGEDPKWQPMPVYSPPFAVSGNGAAGVDLVVNPAPFADVKLKVVDSNGSPPAHAIVEVAREGEVTSNPFEPDRVLRLLVGEEYTISVTAFPVRGSPPVKGKATVRIAPDAMVEVRVEP